MTEERRQYLYDNWLAERTPEDEEEWRETLDEEEAALVASWDAQFEASMASVARKISDAEARRAQAPQGGGGFQEIVRS